MNITNKQIIDLLMSIQTPDTLNIKGFAPNFRGYAYIGKFRIFVKLMRDFSCYGAIVRNWFMHIRVEYKGKTGDKELDRLNSVNSKYYCSTDYFPGYCECQNKPFNHRINTQHILRTIRKALKYRPMKEANGRECIDFKGRHELINIIN
jgi:hypothetical protein